MLRRDLKPGQIFKYTDRRAAPGAAWFVVRDDFSGLNHPILGNVEPSTPSSSKDCADYTVELYSPNNEFGDIAP